MHDLGVEEVISIKSDEPSEEINVFEEVDPLCLLEEHYLVLDKTLMLEQGSGLKLLADRTAKMIHSHESQVVR